MSNPELPSGALNTNNLLARLDQAAGPAPITSPQVPQSTDLAPQQFSLEEFRRIGEMEKAKIQEMRRPKTEAELRQARIEPDSVVYAKDLAELQASGLYLGENVTPLDITYLQNANRMATQQSELEYSQPPILSRQAAGQIEKVIVEQLTDVEPEQPPAKPALSDKNLTIPQGNRETSQEMMKSIRAIRMIDGMDFDRSELVDRITKWSAAVPGIPMGEIPEIVLGSANTPGWSDLLPRDMEATPDVLRNIAGKWSGLFPGLSGREVLEQAQILRRENRGLTLEQVYQQQKAAQERNQNQ